MIHRVILLLSLVGMILALHLWIQKARGFDQGCLGLSKPEFVVQKGCAEASDLAASHLLGVSNAAWGYAFYFGLAVLSFAKIFAPVTAWRRLHLLGEITAAAGLLYSAYLVYAMVAASSFCVLCLTSAALVAALYLLHVCVRVRGSFQPLPETARILELGWAIGGLFVTSGLLVGVLLFVNRLGTRPLTQGNSAHELARFVGDTLPSFIDAEKLLEMRACRFDAAAELLDVEKFDRFELPILGNRDGIPVTVFFDPHCGHCRELHPVILRLLERFKDRARFTLVPRALWEDSWPAVDALLLAKTQDQYLALWRLLFDRAAASRTKITAGDIEHYLRQVGLGGADLKERLGAMRPRGIALRNEAKATNINHVPALYVQGRLVWEGNMSEECVATLIERRLARSKPR